MESKNITQHQTINLPVCLSNFKSILYSYFLSQILMKSKKTRINIVFIGDHRCGKSTLAAHLTYKCGGISSQALQKAEKDAEDRGIIGGKYAWLMLREQAEKMTGSTINISHAQFQTPSHIFNVIDTPGNKKFLKNMITGISQADCAVLVVSSIQQELETCIQAGQIKDQLFLLVAAGIKKLIVCCNQMDHKSVNYSEISYKLAKHRLSEILKLCGFFKLQSIPFIPITSFLGENLTKRSEKFPWYEGPTLLQALQGIEPPKLLIEKPLRICVQRSLKIGGIGAIVLGRVETGVLKQQMNIIIQPNQIKTSVYSIDGDGKYEAFPGDLVGINPRCVRYRDVSRGSVIGFPKQFLDPPKLVLSFLAQVIVVNSVGIIKKGYTPVIHCHTRQVPCRFEEIRGKVDRKTGKITEENSQFLVNGDCAHILMRPLGKIICEAYSEYPSMGRFSVTDKNQVIAVGFIKETQKQGKK